MAILVAPFYTATDRSKLILPILLVLLTSCKQSQEDFFLSRIKNNYSNLYVNDEKSKRQTIENLENYLSENKLNDENLSNIQNILNNMNDGHVVIKDSRPEKNTIYKSGLTFIKGSHFIESCTTCKPVLKKGKYTIVRVENEPIKNYIDNNHQKVSASTIWGRNYRTYRLLEANHNPTIKSVEVSSADSKHYKIELNWQLLEPKEQKCIEHAELENGISYLRINSLWCNYGDNTLSRARIFNNFKLEFEEALKKIKLKDSIIMDLRENGGGGDAEVELVLNAFIKESVLMYKYQYLQTTQEGSRKRLMNMITGQKGLWSKVESQYSNIENTASTKFYTNKIVIMISPGCFSSCEGLSSIMQSHDRAKIVGKTTHGGAGAPIDYSIPGTPYILSLPSCLSWQKNGKLYEGVGVDPDLEVHQSYNNIEDTVLLKAIDLVQ